MIKVYIDVDDRGNIIFPCLAGTSVVPDKEYDYYFELVELDMGSFPIGYAVVDGELIRKNYGPAA